MSNFWEQADLWNADDIRDSDSEVQCFTLSERSRKLCLALIDSVNKASRYTGEVTRDEIDAWQADLAYQLMGDNEECAPVIEPDDPCIEYPPETLFIEYAPNDPFQTPDTIPDGYFVPPWYTNPGIPLPGVLPGDAMVNFLSIAIFADLPDIVAVGLPRFRITVEGEGEVEIEFVKVPQGGNVLVVIDGNPLEQQVFDLNSLPIGDLSVIEDLFDVIVGESLVNTEICEVDFTTPGIHTIDVTFLPNIATDVILGFGGGVRRVSLCGLSAEGVDTNMPQFQVVDCVLQWRPNDDAVWSDLVDLCAVQPPTIVRQDITPPGNMQQDIGGAGYTDIANTDFVWRDGTYPMVGGLEIYPTANQVLLTMKGAVNPYQAAKIMVVQDGAGVDRAWINPRGDGNFSGDASNGALYLMSGGMRLDNTYEIRWKDAGGTYRTVVSSNNGAVRVNSGGAGLTWANLANGVLASMGETGAFVFRYAGTGGQTNVIIRGSPESATNSVDFAIQNNAGANVFTAQERGQVIIDDRFENNASHDNALIIGHEEAGTPGVGYGTGLLMRGKSSTTGAQTMMRLWAAWEVATHATRRARFVLEANDFSGAMTVLEGGVSGASTPTIAVLGATKQPRLAVSGDWQGNVAGKNLAAAMALFGWITDNTTLGAAYAPTPFNVAGDKFGNEALAALITGLDTANYINDLTSDTGAYEYLPPAPIDVEGSWQGLEVGKALALALAENDYIVDLTEVNSTDDVTIDRRCAATAACRWMLQQLYYLAGSEMCYDNVAYVSESRWISVQAYVLTNGLHVETQDFMFERWAEPLYGEFGENNSPVVTFAEHFDELVAYLPTIEEAFYCSLTTSGILTSDGRLEFLDLMLATNLTGDVPQDIETWFYQFVRHFSEVDFGLMIAAALQTDYASTIDCSAFVCASSGFSWCKQYNFTLGTYTPPFEIVSGDHVFGATFNPGWKTDDTGILRIEFPFPTNQVTLKYNVTSPDDAYVVMFGTIDGMFEDNLSVEGGIYEETIEIPEAFRADGWYFRAACNPVNCVVTIKFVTNMQGTGIEPTDLNDC